MNTPKSGTVSSCDCWRAVAARWLASALLVVVLEGLRRSGVSLIRGRRALVFWVTVMLLHWTATPMAERGLPVEELLVAAPAVITLAAGAGLALGGWRRRGRLFRLRPSVAAITPRETPAVSRWLLPVVAGRPPPA
jgi:hypothetical protein